MSAVTQISVKVFYATQSVRNTFKIKGTVKLGIQAIAYFISLHVKEDCPSQAANTKYFY